MATINKYTTTNGDLRYRVRWRIGSQARSKSFDRWKTAKDFKIKLEHDMRSGAYVDQIDITVSEFLEKWLNERSNKIEYNTYQSYKYTFKHVNTCIGTIPLQKLNTGHVERMCNDLLDTISPNYVKRAFKYLNIALNYAVRHRLIQANPCFIAEPPKKDTKKERTIVQPADISSYLSLVADTWTYPAIAIAIICGLRRGELCGLKWEDVDLEKGIINVKRSVYIQDGMFKEKAPKNGSPYTTFMPNSLCVVLKKHRNRQKRNKLLLGKSYVTSPYVITLDDGTRPRPESLYRAFTRKVKKSGLPYVNIHGLRHTSASLLNYENTDIKTIAELQGRRSLDVTANTYVHSLTDAKKKAVSALDKYIENP